MALQSTTTKDEFKKNVLENNKPVLVDFWAAWCMPCKMMAPTLEKVGSSMDDQLDVVKVNVEESQENMMLAQEYGVQGIPNLQLFKEGKVVKTLVGARPEAVLIDEIKNELS